MADVEFTQDVGMDRDPSGTRIGKLTSLAGAAISLGLMAGIGVWGYKLVVRDATGIPVVRALDGPMRIPPEKPGGQSAQHQGLAVNAVAADGVAAAPADRLVLAPQPVSLSEEDAPQSALPRPEPRPATTENTETAPADPAPAATVANTTEPKVVTPNQVARLGTSDIDALVEQITRDVEPLEAPEAITPVAAPIVAPTPLVLEQEPALSADVPGVSRSVRPPSRPSGLATNPSATPVSAPAGGSVEVDASTVPVGSRVVQLGAYETPEIAREEWTRIAGRFGDYMQDKQRIVQQASSGGRTFYRLRAMGFDDLSDARRFCSALVAEGTDCIPVVTR